VNDSHPPPTKRPRVVLLTSPALYGAVIINALANTPGIELVGVGLTNRVFKNKGLLATARTMIQRTGWPYTWHSILVSNVAWTRLRLTGRPSGLKQVGDQVRYLRDVNSAETRNWLEELAPDYVASYYFNQWIGPKVRTIPRQACVNMHPSLLPALAGPDPVFRTLQRNLTTTGLTIHRVDDGFDTGDILYQETTPVPDGVSLMELYLQQIERGAQTLGEWLAGGKQSSLEPGDNAGDDYQTFPSPQEVRQFRQAGGRLGGLRELRQALSRVE
jgi:hypothetical protein